MFPRVLERLRDADTFLCVAHLSMPGALRKTLMRSEAVQDLHRSLRDGALPEECVRIFVSDLLQGFRPGEQFAHDDALAAIAVAVESRHTRFSNEYLSSLAALENPEMSISRHVARECLRKRSFVTNIVQRTRIGRVSPVEPALPHLVEKLPRVNVDPGEGQSFDWDQSRTEAA